ncbi:MAG: hypothetical protein FD170_3608, partial [Bacteroidetes bacterium]
QIGSGISHNDGRKQYQKKEGEEEFEFQGFKDSKIQRFKDSKIQRFNPSTPLRVTNLSLIQRFKDSRFKDSRFKDSKIETSKIRGSNFQFYDLSRYLFTLPRQVASLVIATRSRDK